MIIRKRILGQRFLMVAISVVLVLMPLQVFAKDIRVASNGELAWNIDDQNYTWNWASVVSSYLVPVSSGYMLLQSENNNSESPVIYAQYFDESFQYQRTVKVNLELPAFGGFYASSRGYYYLLSGQENYEESNFVECYRVTKYDTDWNRLGSVGLSDCNTYAPFEAGSARMTESENVLVVHTCHQMYKSDDGLRHQANLTFTVDTDNMSIPYSRYGVSNISTGYVSHSFNQFAIVDNDLLVTADHGDAYPRSIVVAKYDGAVSNGVLQKDWGGVSSIDVLPIAGKTGNNETRATLGGLAQVRDAYLVAGSSIDQSDENNSVENIFLGVVSKNLESSHLIWLTSNDGTRQWDTPQIVALPDGRAVVLWSDYDYYSVNNCVYYQLIDETGNLAGAVRSMPGVLSDCAPIFKNNQIVWYATDGQFIDFYTIALSELGAYATDGGEGAMYRLYNPNSGEHFYTSQLAECNSLVNVGWNYESVAWNAPTVSDIPVYRVYNPNSGEHHYTTNAGERDVLLSIGWNDEGIGWYSASESGNPLYRLYNSNATGAQEAGAHHYTKDAAERDYLISIGWNDEGIGWYGL